VRHDPRGRRVEEFERALPEVVALARGLVVDDTAVRIRAMEPDDAIEAVWERLPK
jgi:hypothetical protein